MDASKLEEILRTAEKEIVLSRKDILSLLSITTDEELTKVSFVARLLRERYFQDKVFLYGFIYFSTYCRNNCTFCLYRNSNQNYPRYRKSTLEIMATARCLANSGAHLLDLTMGEDPLYHNSKDGFKDLAQIIKELRRETQTPLMISPGVVAREILSELKAAGADWYACYQETHNTRLYGTLRTGQSYDERMSAKLLAKQMGYLIEEGLLTGVGESFEDIAESILTMKAIGADQVRVMTFVPQENTPLADRERISSFREQLIIAVMRLVMPYCLIPASLDIDGLKGLKERLRSGANVITSIIPPSAGMAGVSQSTLDIDDGNRTIKRVIPILKESNLQPATLGEYQAWVKSRKACANHEKEGIKCG